MDEQAPARGAFFYNALRIPASRVAPPCTARKDNEVKRSIGRSCHRVSAMLLSSLCLWGCAVQLAPSYDEAVVEGLSAANTDAMILFASVSGGTDSASFPTRSDKYNEIIGKLDSLALVAGARPVPANSLTVAVNKALDKRGVEPLPDDGTTIPSVHAIQRVSATVAKMRDTDKVQGVTATEVAAFRGQAVIYLDQATTYESFLQR